MCVYLVYVLLRQQLEAEYRGFGPYVPDIWLQYQQVIYFPYFLSFHFEYFETSITHFSSLKAYKVKYLRHL